MGEAAPDRDSRNHAGSAHMGGGCGGPDPARVGCLVPPNAPSELPVL